MAREVSDRETAEAPEESFWNQPLPVSLPSLNARVVEGLLAAVVAIVLKSLRFGSTAELASALLTLTLGVLLCLGLAELIAWRRWSSR